MEPVFRQLLHRPKDSHKYDFGHVLVIGGSPGMVGAPFLAAQAALRIGAGLVTIASSAPVIDKLEKRVEEIMTLAFNDDAAEAQMQIEEFIKQREVTVVIIGPGMTPDSALPILKYLLKVELPLIIDGGGLTALGQELSALQNHTARLILTPHHGEFQRLVSETLPEDQPELLEVAKGFAEKYGLTLVLKGRPTHVISQEGDIYENTTGGPALATAGTGDVLAGMIGGILAQNIGAVSAAQAAVYLHGLAGDLATQDKTEAGVIASDVIKYIPKALQRAES